MAIYMVKCPSCGSATELNDEKDFCFCTECGKKILASEAELYAPADDPTPADTPMPVPEAAPAYVPQLTLEPDPAPVPEPADPGEEAMDEPSAPVIPEGPPLNNAEQLEYLIMHQPQPLDSVIFRSSDECAEYVNSLHTLILDLSERYGRMNHAEEAPVSTFWSGASATANTSTPVGCASSPGRMRRTARPWRITVPSPSPKRC